MSELSIYIRSDSLTAWGVDQIYRLAFFSASFLSEPKFVKVKINTRGGKVTVLMKMKALCLDYKMILFLGTQFWMYIYLGSLDCDTGNSPYKPQHPKGCLVQ